ncbi:MAG: hypothetical protein J2P13_10755 [Acidobacteria bacterium]|nr:hypothetical protein [Acidobacteriota bacterium]
MKLPSVQIGAGIAFGAGIGAAAALLIGTGAAWLAFGIVIGIVIGAGMSRRKIQDAPASQAGRKWGADFDWS